MKEGGGGYETTDSKGVRGSGMILTPSWDEAGGLLGHHCSCLEVIMNCGGVDQREHHGAENSADDGDGQGLQHGGASANPECQREHPCDGGQRRHGDGA